MLIIFSKKLMKFQSTVFILFFALLTSAQNKDSISFFEQFNDKLSVNYESISQWYLNDSYIDDQNLNLIGDEKLRSTNYLRLDYLFNDNFSAGLQLESFSPINLLNMSNLYDNDLGLATYYICLLYTSPSPTRPY